MRSPKQVRYNVELGLRSQIEQITGSTRIFQSNPRNPEIRLIRDSMAMVAVGGWALQVFEEETVFQP